MKIMNVFNFMFKHPFIFVIPLLVLAAVLFIIIILTSTLPTFNDPTMGFEARGTDISKRLYTLHNILEKTYNVKPLVEIKMNENESLASLMNFDKANYNEEEDYIYDENVTNILSDNQDDICDSFDFNPSAIIFKAKSSFSLYTIDSLKSMCQLEQALLSKDDCISGLKKPISHQDCCPIKSLTNFVIRKLNITKCEEINKQVIKKLDYIFHKCILNGTIKTIESCELSGQVKFCQNIIAKCVKHLSFLSSIINIVNKNAFDNYTFQPKYAISYLPYMQGRSSHNLNERLKSINNKDIEIVAANLGLKFIEFEQELLFQLVFLSPSIFCILFIIYLYTESLIVMILNVFQLFCSFTLTFFVYHMIFHIEYFPFINLLSIFILVAIGLDGTFVAFYYWSFEKSKLNILAPDILLKRTCCKSLKSIFAASITTSASFYSTYFFNSIPMLKAFAIFSGTILLINFFVSCAFIPSMVVLSNRCSSFSILKCFTDKSIKSNCCYDECFQHLQVLNILMRLISRLKYLIIILFFIMFILSLVIIFVAPKIKVSNLTEMQLMRSPNLFNKYSNIINDNFWSNKEVTYNLSIIIVFGIHATDDRSMIDASNSRNEKKISFDTNFNISTQESQLFLSNFCRQLRKILSYGYINWDRLTPKYSDCFIESFKSLMRRPCNIENSYKCCNLTHFPYTAELFNHCLDILSTNFAELLYLPGQSEIGGFRYLDNGELKGFIIRMDGPAFKASSYEEMENFYNEFDRFVTKEISSAPSELSTAWFITDDRIKLYDLQKNLIKSLPLSFLLSIFVSLIITFILTCNPLATLLVGLTIASSVAETVAILTLLGWTLDIVESATIIVTNGFMLDFILHYTIAIINCESPEEDKSNIQDLHRFMHTMHIFSNFNHISVCGAITAAAFCSLIVGLCFVFLSVLVYHQIGVFILTVTIVGWINATFFHVSLMMVCGSWLALNVPNCRRRVKKENVRVDKRDSMGQKHVYRFSTQISYSDDINLSNGNELNNNI